MAVCRWWWWWGRRPIACIDRGPAHGTGTASLACQGGRKDRGTFWWGERCRHVEGEPLLECRTMHLAIA